MLNVGGARLEISRDMQMPRYSSYRDTVGTEYNSIYIDCEYLSFFYPAKMYKYSKFIYLARITFNFYIKKNEFI